jgi:hypothetical protein
MPLQRTSNNRLQGHQPREKALIDDIGKRERLSK